MPMKKDMCVSVAAKKEKRGRALVSGPMLKWARESTRLTVEQAAKSAGIANAETLRRAEQDEDSITFRQLERLAHACRLPLRLFYLPQPPPQEPLPVDFRDAQNDEYPADVIKMLRVARWRRDAAIDLLAESDQQRREFPRTDNDAEIISALRPLVCATAWKARDINVPAPSDDGTQSLTLTKELIEGAFPALVFEFAAEAYFRGCSLYDDRLSIIILSSGDSPYARRFTLVHEMAHLFLRESGVCSPFRERIDNNIERRCNYIAGESTAPKDEIIELASKAFRNRDEDGFISHLSSAYRLSNSAIAVRLGQLGILDGPTVHAKLEQYRSRWDAKKKREAENKGGPHAHLLQAHRLGPTYSALVFQSMDNEALTITQAADLLGVSPSHSSIDSLREKSVTVYGR